MLKTALLPCLGLFIVPLSAQITLTNAYFPSVGDTFKVANATTATARQARITAAGDNQTWDFRFLQARSVDTTIFMAVPDSTARAFSGADVAVKVNARQVMAYNKTTTRFELMGYDNPNVAGLTFNSNAVFSPPVLERRAPLAYNSTNTNSSGYALTGVATDILPDTLFRNLPIRADSIRLRFQTNRQDKVDAWGTLSLPNGTFPVLRERRFEVTQPKTDVRTNLLPIWIDVTALLFAGVTTPKDTTIEYYFWSTTAKEPLLLIRANAQEVVQSVQYKAAPIRTALSDFTEGGLDFNIYPNPVQNEFKIDARQLVQQTAVRTGTVALYDVLGKQVYNHSIDFIQSQTLQINLPDGVYICQLRDAEQRILGSKKVFIQK